MLHLHDQIQKIKELLTQSKRIYRYFPKIGRGLARYDRYNVFLALLDVFNVEYVEIDNPPPNLPISAGFLLVGRLPQEAYKYESGCEVPCPVSSCFMVQVVSPYNETEPGYAPCFDDLATDLKEIANSLKLDFIKDGNRFFFLLPGTPPPKLPADYFC